MTEPHDKNQPLSDFDKLNLDPYTHAVLRKMGAETLNSFSAAQRKKLIESISACSPLQKHPLDIRGVVPFFFVRYYFVILGGRDRRKRTRHTETDRRRQMSTASSLFAGVLFVSFVAIALFVIFFIIAYLVKSKAGINIFPDKHLSDFLLSHRLTNSFPMIGTILNR